ncbi:hypothetical protein NLJ89_g11695 [Agrocybe chaxingu]|uniref:Uncharacterized protein n=1 Tax=Agrocybe chaxingu TaxID=84603 RepID=A0A9W8MQY1_9AGAR|nr:hypothetical protein NLJ89_g11695 [Agrocybe chaxingu]
MNRPITTYLPALPDPLPQSHVDKYTPFCPSRFPFLRVEDFGRKALLKGGSVGSGACRILRYFPPLAAGNFTTTALDTCQNMILLNWRRFASSVKISVATSTYHRLSARSLNAQ